MMVVNLCLDRNFSLSPYSLLTGFMWFFSGKVKEMLRAHDYDEVKTLENLKNAMLSKEMNNIPILTVIETTETGTICTYTRNLHKLKRFFNCILY